MATSRRHELPGLNAEDLVRELQTAQLGDERRNGRLLQLMEQLASNPSSSFASMCSSEAELEALYRFMRNVNIDWQQVLEPHIEMSCARAREAGQVLALHDTSTVRVADDAQLDSYIQTGKRGFFAHMSLLIDGNDARRPLGVVSAELMTRRKSQRRTKTKKGRAMSGAETSKLQDRESLRWQRAVEETQHRLQGVDIIHVMDREGDNYELLSKLCQTNCDFVIRQCKDRRARMSDAESELWEKLEQVLQQAADTKLTRQVVVGKRKAKTAPGADKASPARAMRSAHLRLACGTVELKKPNYLPMSAGYPPSLTVQVVRVYEPRPPKGQTPIEWVLLTSLPVQHPEDVERVVDIYRQRWLIEEFFKALKTGCGYGRRRLTNPQSIFNSFAIFVPVAWKALAIRRLADGSGQPVHRVLDAAELAVLRAKARDARKPLSHKPTAEQVLALVARMGGHRKSSGPPGWLTLMRGTEKLQTLAEGWRIARGEM